jgi:hypothetical protein
LNLGRVPCVLVGILFIYLGLGRLLGTLRTLFGPDFDFANTQLGSGADGSSTCERLGLQAGAAAPGRLLKCEAGGGSGERGERRGHGHGDRGVAGDRAGTEVLLRSGPD